MNELSKANTHSRTAYTEKLSAFTAENNQLKAQVTGKTSSKPSTSETPKVLAPGMYNLGQFWLMEVRVAFRHSPLVTFATQICVDLPKFTILPTCTNTLKDMIVSLHQLLAYKSLFNELHCSFGQKLVAPAVIQHNRSLNNTLQRKQLETDAMWCFFNEFLTHVEPKNLQAFPIRALVAGLRLSGKIQEIERRLQARPDIVFAVMVVMTQREYFGSASISWTSAFVSWSLKSKKYCHRPLLKQTYIALGSRGTDLYSITLQDTSTPNPICLMAKASSSQAWLWHRRLSHLNFDTINLLSKYDIVTGLPKLKFVKDHLCSSCELGKAKRKSFKTKTTPSSKRRLQILHMDLCGPMRVESFNEGIEHQTSTARTPEQKGVVERRNRTLIEVARTMLSAAKVPLYFWAEAISTACFTQNHSLVIPRHEKAPYHIINGRKPSVKFFHIFGSLCYIVRDGENLDKMKEKAETVTTSNKLDLLFSLMFHELLNGTTPVVLKSSIVNTANAPDKRQQQNTTSSTSTTVAADIPPLNIQTTTETTSQAPTQAPTVSAIENINQAETNKEYAQVEEDEFINIFSTPVQERGETSSRHVDSSNMHTFYQRHPSEHRWTKDHPLEQVIRNPSQLIRTRCQLETDGEMCMFAVTLRDTVSRKESTSKSHLLQSLDWKQSGYSLCDKLVTWSPKKQDCTSMSSTEVEYVSLSACCAKVLWLRTQLTNYGFHFDKIPMYCDSKAAITISCNPVQHSRTKHIDVRYHFIKKQVENGGEKLVSLVSRSRMHFNVFSRRLIMKVGHTIDRCFDLIGYPLGYNKNSGLKQNGSKTFNANSASTSNENGATLSFTNEQIMKLMNLINEVPSGSMQANMAVNQYITISTVNMFGIIDKSDLNLTMGHPNGTLAKIKYVGNLRLSKNVVLFDVLVVPEYCVSLLSINKLIKDSNQTATCYVSKSLWHNRLGHPCDQAVNTREPFPLSDHKTIAISELVHVDLWGPYTFISKDGFRCFMTIVDDYTRAVWIYLIKTKDEVYGLFVNFINLIHSLFKCSITNVRSDNGTEFVNSKMNDLFNSLGIIHETSCAYSPQQNGVTERKYKHLLNVARSLLFQSGIPLNMWIKCILTVAYLIHMLPSSVLNGKSPFEHVYGLKPKLSHLTSFGCLCFSSVLNNYDKFFARDVKFYETVFPFKINSSLQSVEENRDNNINNLNLFDEKHFDTSLSPNDDGRVNFAPNDEGNVYPCTRSTQTFDGNLLENGSHVQSAIRRPCRQSKMPPKFNYYVIGSNVKYGLENSGDVFVALFMYVDDIVITGNNLSEIEKFKVFLKYKFQIKDLGKLKYFLGIEVLDNVDGICLSQRKYCLELLYEYEMLTAKHVDTPLPENTNLNHIESDDDKSSVEAEYRSMASATCEVIQLSNLLGDMGVKGLLPVVLYCDNSSALQIAVNPVFHEKSKHFEIDVHLVKEKVASGVIKTENIHTTQQIVDVLTKTLDIEQHKILCEKLGLLDMFKVEKLEGGC
ncbi:integrase, catalytic region, zinc finger, CCHC-type containing protein [Tanacetum coccineum]